MIYTGTKVCTKGGNPYTIFGTQGTFLLLGQEHPYEGCEIEECKIFPTKAAMERYIDNNPIIYRKYVATWINFS